MGIGMATLLRYNLTQKELYLYGWRIAFWSGLFIGSIGFTLRVFFLPDDKTDLTPQYEYSEAIRESDSNDVMLIDTPIPQPESNSNLKPNESESTIVHLAKDSFHHFINAFKLYYKEIFCLILICPVWNCGYYSVFMWLGYYLSSEDMIGSDEAIPNIWIIMFIINTALIIVLPLQGALADWCTKAFQEYKEYDKSPRQIRSVPILDIKEETSPMLESKKHSNSNSNMENGLHIKSEHNTMITAPSSGVTFLLMVSAGWLCVFAIPAMMLISTRQLSLVLIGICTLGICVGTFGAVLPSYLVYIIPNKSKRYIILGISYNVASCLFAGTAAVAQTALVMRANIEGVNSGLYVGIYFSCIAAVSLIAQHYMNNHSKVVKTMSIEQEQEQDSGIQLNSTTANPMGQRGLNGQNDSTEETDSNDSGFNINTNTNTNAGISPITDPHSGLTPTIPTERRPIRDYIYNIFHNNTNTNTNNNNNNTNTGKIHATQSTENGKEVISI